MYIVTGCAGFIGFHFSKFLIEKKIKIIGIDNINSYYSKNYKLDRLNILKKSKHFKFYKIDLNNKKKLSLIFQKNKITKVIHFAAQPGVIYSYKNPQSYKKNNVKATKNLVEFIIRNKIKKFIFCSSSSVYGDHKRYPIKENFKLKPINYYAKTKIECEKIIKKKLDNLECSTSIIRPFTVYGPYGRPDMLLLKIMTSLRLKKKINIYNYGKHLRDFTYIDDVIKIVFKISNLLNPKINFLNICASNPIEINNVINLIQKNEKKIMKLNFLKKRKGEMQITYGSNFKLIKFIKKYKFTKFESGYKKTLSWFKKYKNKKYLEFSN